MEQVSPTDNSSQGMNETERAPFMIRVEHLDVDRRGAFRPAAFIRFASSLRTSGLLVAMTPEAVKDLLMLLTFVSPNGICAPHVEQLAEAMGVPVAKVRGRIERLAAMQFQGQKLVVGSRRANGLETYSPLPWLAPIREDATSAHHCDEAQPILHAAPRQAVIDHSRATYGRPRTEVESEVERQLGHHRPKDTSDGKMGDTAKTEKEQRPQPEDASGEIAEVRNMLIEAGLLPEQAETLLARYDLLSIRRQLAWLPYRGAKNLAGFLMAAVKDNYEAPPMLRPAPSLHPKSYENGVDVPDNNFDCSLEIPPAPEED